MKPVVSASNIRKSSTLLDANIVKMLSFEIEEDKEKRQRRSENTRQQILSTAIQCFMESGFDGVSTYDISSSVGVTQPVILYHYKSKEGLWKASMDQMFGQFRNALLDKINVLNEADSTIFFKEIIKHIILWPSHHPFMVRIVLDTKKTEEERLEWLYKKHIIPTQKVIAHILEQGQKAGIMRKLPITNIHYLLMGSSMIYSLSGELLTKSKSDPIDEGYIDGQVTCFMAMLFYDEEA